MISASLWCPSRQPWFHRVIQRVCNIVVIFFRIMVYHWWVKAHFGSWFIQRECYRFPRGVPHRSNWHCPAENKRLLLKRSGGMLRPNGLRIYHPICKLKLCLVNTLTLFKLLNHFDRSLKLFSWLLILRLYLLSDGGLFNFLTIYL